MHTITSRWQQQDQVRIEWNLSKRCNYDCSYCPPEIHDHSSPHTDIEILKNTISEKIEENTKNYYQFYFNKIKFNYFTTWYKLNFKTKFHIKNNQSKYIKI